MEVSVKTVAMLVLVVMIVSVIFMGFSGWFDSMAGNFAGNVTYPTP
ncbi:hypothetical protein [Candidatus Nanohalovita haloferacivicina]|nr:hypothetical protein HBNXNv_1077 [Candidatus Nanohalobia archaeon BNXNv]